jgi:hypothetical protein
MTTTKGEPPRPEELSKDTLHLGGPATPPSFVPTNLGRRSSSGASTSLGQGPAGLRPGPMSTRPQQHVPRTLRDASGMRGNGRRAGAFVGGTTVAAQFSVDYPDDVWFYDGQSGWVMLDNTSESGLELMNMIVSDARQQQTTLYYTTDDTTGKAVNVYAF